MITIGNVSPELFKTGRAATMDRLASAGRIIAQAQSLRGMPGTPVRRPQAAVRVPGMSCREAETILARLKARSERSEREHRAEMRRYSVDDDYSQPVRVDAATHDIASAFVQIQLAELNRQERFDGHPTVDSATRLRFIKGDR